MQVRVLKRIQSAVQSIVDCTSPIIETNGVNAAADGMRSPYVTHRRVEYSESDVRYGELLAASGRHKLLIQSLSSGPSDFPYSTPSFGLMTEWEGGVVPFDVVRPVIDLAEELGLPAIDWREDVKLVRAYVLTPSLATYHFGQPVFWLANEDNTPLDITEYIRDEPVAEVGGVRLFRLDVSEWGDDYWLLSIIPLWNDERRVFGVARDDAGRAYDIRRADAAPVVAALHRGETVLLARVDGPATLVSEDGGRAIDGCCLAVAPASQIALARV